MKQHPAKYFFFAFTCVAAFCWGYFSSPQTAMKMEMSSEAPSRSSNTFETLPCPTESQYAEMAAKIHLKIPVGAPACDNSQRALLGKALLFMTRLNMNAPANWLSDVQPSFRDLLGYMAENSREVDLDPSQEGSIAYNATTEQKIYIGNYFFGMDPLTAVGTLLHEARHSVRSAQGHVLCRGGDIPRTDGGCDESFDVTQKDAGAYSWETMWYAGMALYGLNLSPGDREFLMATSLTTLASRFNVIPGSLAKKTDVLIALSKTGELLVADTESTSFTPIKLKFPFEGEKIQRIDFSNRTSGVMIITDQGHIYSWTYRSGLDFYNPGVIPTDLPVRSASRLTMPGAINRTMFAVLSDNNTVWTTKLLPGKSKFSMVQLTTTEDLRDIPPFDSFFLALYGDTVFLTKEGGLYMLSHSIAARPLFIKTEGLQDPQGWVQGTGGVVYEDLILLNKSGELKTAISHYEEIDDDHSVTTYTMVPKNFPAKGRIIKYFQGLKYEAALTDQGQIFLRTYDDKVEPTFSSRPDLVDFTIIHNPEMGTRIVPK